MHERNLSDKEKIGYGSGSAASHIVFDNVMLYMMFFYTDTFGIPPDLSVRYFCWRICWMPFPIPVGGSSPTISAAAGANFGPGFCSTRSRSALPAFLPIARPISGLMAKRSTARSGRTDVAEYYGSLDSRWRDDVLRYLK